MRANPVLAELGGYPMAALQERARAMREAGQPLIDFSIGDPVEPTPELIRKALTAAVPEVSQYPTVPGLASLRRAVAGYLERRLGVVVDPDTQVLPTSGSKEAIFSTPFAFVAPGTGQAVVWGSPGYPIYERGARFAGAESRVVVLGDDFVLHPEMIPEAWWETAVLVWVNSPHNPSGAVAGVADLEALLGRARASDVLVLSDECYLDLYEDEPPPSILQAAGPGSRGTLSYLSLSKRSGMTGYRSGAVVGDPEAIALLKSLRTSVGVAPQEFVQEAAAAAWADDEHAARRREIFAAKRAVLREAFDGLGIRVVGSRAGIYLWVEVGDDQAVSAGLLEAGVLVSPGRVFGPGGEGFLRLALVPTVEECRSAAEVLRTCLATVS